MSFILDALKKSEIERQRQSIPGLVDTGIARPRPRLPLWVIALGILLGANLVVLVVVLVQSRLSAPHARIAAQSRADSGAAAGSPAVADSSSAAGSSTAEAPVSGGTDSSADRHFSPLDAAPEYAPEIPVTAAAMPAPAVHPPAGSTSSGTRILHHRDPLLTDEDYKADEEVLPSISEINLTGTEALPELHLDVHVYATNPAERFVYVNMRKYHEGSPLAEGPTVERIRRDGVILNYHGLRFLLPRQ